MPVFAQIRIEKSEPMTTKSDESHKIILLKSGRTFYFNTKVKDKQHCLEVSVFDKERKLVSSHLLTGEWTTKDVRSMEICAIYEIGGEPVVFIRHIEKKIQSLFRLRINPDDGTILKEDILKSLPDQHRFGANRAILSMMPGKITVEKDNATDAYAVIVFDVNANGLAGPITVQHYDQRHRLINSGLFTSNSTGRVTKYMGACVDGTKAVFLTVYNEYHNPAITSLVSSNDKPNYITLAKLAVSDSVFTSTKLDFTEDFKDTYIQMVCNDERNSLQMVLNSLVKYKSGNTQLFLCFLASINRETLKVESVKPLSARTIDAYGKQNMPGGDPFTGLPNGVFLNKDHGITLLEQDKGGGFNYYKGRIGIAKMSATGEDKAGYMISPTSAVAVSVKTFYHNARLRGFTRSGFGSYYYFSRPGQDYVILNERIKKLNTYTRRERRARKTKMNTLCYTLKNGNISADFIFGAPTRKKEGTNCSIDAISDDQNGTIATLMEYEHKRHTEKRLVWLHFD